jgi:hypothetical protein
MSEPTFDQEDSGFTFTDEDFERRYYTSARNTPPRGAGITAPAAGPRAAPTATQPARSPNKFMRALLRRRLASAAEDGSGGNG